MSKRNATASWSGYSHQGQVGLLIALREIQSTSSLDTHFVQFETYEDVATYHQPFPGATKRYLTVHQVKAYYSTGNSQKNTYKEVLNEVFEPGNSRYLHTAVEITDWTTSETTNKNDVIRYPYDATRNYCGTTAIEEYIKIELRKILGEVAASVVNVAHDRLSSELDHRIRTEHQKASKSLFDIKFCLREIDTLIKDESPFIQKEIYGCRKLFYDTYIEIIKEDEAIEPARVSMIENTIIQKINALDDAHFLLFLQRMNLNETKENLASTQVYYNRQGLKQVFFRMLIEIIGTDPVLLEQVVKYPKPGAPSRIVLTSIINEERDKLSVIENIIANLDSQNLLWENHSLVNKEIEAELVTNNPSISIVSSVPEMEEDKNKFMFFSSTKLIKREEAKNILNDGGAHCKTIE